MKPKARWQRGDFVRVVTDYPTNLAHRGEVGVVISGDSGYYYRVWFGPDSPTGDPQDNWRGYYGEWLEVP